MLDNTLFIECDNPRKVSWPYNGWNNWRDKWPYIPWKFSEDPDHIDDIYPPDVDSLADNDQESDEVIARVTVEHMPRPIEVHYFPSENMEEPKPHLQSNQRINQRNVILLRVLLIERRYPTFLEITSKGNEDAGYERRTSKSVAKEMFENFLHDNVYEYFVKETVRYAVNGKNIFDFVLNLDEVRIFIGFLLLTNYHKLPSERLYRSQDDVGLIVVKQAMSSNTIWNWRVSYIFVVI